MRICFRICCMLSNSIFEYAFECCEYAVEYAEQYTLRICGLSFLCQPFWPGRQFANLRSFLTKSFVCEFAFLFGQAVCSRVPAPPSPGRLTFSLWTRSVFPNWMPSAIFLWAGIVFLFRIFSKFHDCPELFSNSGSRQNFRFGLELFCPFRISSKSSFRSGSDFQFWISSQGLLWAGFVFFWARTFPQIFLWSGIRGNHFLSVPENFARDCSHQLEKKSRDCSDQVRKF